MPFKSDFSRGVPAAKTRSASKVAKREKGVWQRRYREHAIRDDADFERHVDYIHYNPVKHGLITGVADWPHSSFHRYVAQGLLPEHWGSDLMDLPDTSANNRVGTALRAFAHPTLAQALASCSCVMGAQERRYPAGGIMANDLIVIEEESLDDFDIDLAEDGVEDETKKEAENITQFNISSYGADYTVVIL